MSGLIPLMVRTFGRTGSTLLMQILGSNSRICFERLYPFEHRYLAYVYNLSRVVSLPAKVDEPWDNDVMFRGKNRLVGCLPYGDTPSLNSKKLSESVFQSTWNEFSAQMRHSAGLAPGEQAYYAEKIPPYLAEPANNLLLARNIFLLRDPRDEMVSIKSFNSKRGFNSFGWLDEDTDESYARKMCRNRQVFMRNMMEFETNSRRIYLRYEDLINRQDEEVARLSNWLGLELSSDAIAKNKEILEIHMTSKDGSSSVERWRDELSDDVKEIFSDNLGDELSSLGYAV